MHALFERRPRERGGVQKVLHRGGGVEPVLPKPGRDLLHVDFRYKYCCATNDAVTSEAVRRPLSTLVSIPLVKASVELSRAITGGQVRLQSMDNVILTQDFPRGSRILRQTRAEDE